MRNFKSISLFILLLAVGQSFNIAYCAENSSEKKATRAALLKEVPEKDMIIYRPTNEVKGIITVFTDLDCGYCHDLHSDIPKLMEYGIEVRYIAFPRRGMNSDSYNRMVSVWCSKSPKDAMMLAMRGEKVGILNCTNPISNHLKLGRKVGISGTPTIFYQDGAVYNGYMSPESLARQAIKHSADKQS